MDRVLDKTSENLIKEMAEDKTSDRGIAYPMASGLGAPTLPKSCHLFLYCCRSAQQSTL